MISNNLPSTPKVSVILPVYNVAAYLKHSLSCLLNQTLREIEIICVDDGSTDASVDITREFMAKDARIRLFLNEHSFAGTARNTGLAHASGDWVMFLDPDDYYDVTMLEELYTRAEREQVDVLLYGIYNVFDRKMDYGGPSSLSFINDFYDGKVFNAKDLGDFVWSLNVYPFSKIYRRAFLLNNQIRFQTIQNTNDASFAFEVLITAEKMILHNKAYYYYRFNRAKNTRMTKGENLSCVIRAYEYSFERCWRYPIFPFCETGFKAVILSNYLWHFMTYASQGGESKRFFFEYIKQYIRAHFVDDSAVQEFLKQYAFLHYAMALIIRRCNYRTTCVLLRAKPLFKIQGGTNWLRLRFLGIPVWKYRSSARRITKFFLGIPYAQIKYAGGYRRNYIFGIPFFKQVSLSYPVMLFLRYIRNRVSSRDSQRVCCIFSLPMKPKPSGQEIRDIVKGTSSGLHFVVQNATQETLIREYVPAERIASLLCVESGPDLTKVLWDSLRGARSFMDVKFIAITLLSPHSRSIESNIKR